MAVYSHGSCAWLRLYEARTFEYAHGDSKWHPTHRRRKMLKVGGGALDIIEKFWTLPTFPLKPRPVGVNNAARPLWQEFLGYSNEETNSKSTRTDSVATYS